MIPHKISGHLITRSEAYIFARRYDALLELESVEGEIRKLDEFERF
jgi:hypothetical protein